MTSMIIRMFDSEGVNGAEKEKVIAVIEPSRDATGMRIFINPDLRQNDV